MTVDNANRMRRLYQEAWGQGVLDVVDDLVDATFVHHDPQGPEVNNRQEYKQLISMYRKAYPDLHFAIEDTLESGDKVIIRYTASGTQDGDLPGIPATGKYGEVTGISITRFLDGKAVEAWTNWDTLGMLQNLGVVPRT